MKGAREGGGARRAPARRAAWLALPLLLAVWAAIAVGEGRGGGADAPQDAVSAAASREAARADAEPAAPADMQALPDAAASTDAAAPADAAAPTDAPTQAATQAPTGASPSPTHVAATEPERAREAPACVVADEAAPRSGLDDWAYTVLDTRFKLTADYVPPDLVPLDAALADVAAGAAPSGMQLRAVLLDDLRAMLEGAEAAGVHLAFQSAYRSYAYQAGTFDHWVEEDGYDQALRSSARAGHSEHQLGTAFDLRSRGGPAAWDLPDWAATPEGAWVAANAWRYGFVMSYPPGEESTTCYMYEPWHYRYVGRDLAAAVRASGLTLREHLMTLAEGGDAR